MAAIFFLYQPIVQASPHESPKTEDTETAEEIKEEGMDPTKIVESQLESLDLNELTEFWDSIKTEYGGFLPESQKGSLYDFMVGNKSFDLQGFLP